MASNLSKNPLFKRNEKVDERKRINWLLQATTELITIKWQTNQYSVMSLGLTCTSIGMEAMAFAVVKKVSSTIQMIIISDL
jgi:hypothetical protein